MAKVKVLWGRIVFFFLAVGGGAGAMTYPMWEPALHGTALDGLPQTVAAKVESAASGVNLGRAGDVLHGIWDRVRSWWPFGGQNAEIAALLPADTLAVMMIQRPDHILEDLTPFMKALSEGAGGEQSLTQLKQQSRQKLGSDLTDPDTLATLDPDLSRSWAAAMIAVSAAPGMDASRRRPALVFLLPVHDEDTAADGLKALYQKENSTVLEQNGSEGTWYQVSNGMTFAAYRSHLLLVQSIDSEAKASEVYGLTKTAAPASATYTVTANDVMATLSNASEHLNDVKGFRQHLKVYGNDWQLFGFLNVQSNTWESLTQLDQEAREALTVANGAAVSAVVKIDDHQARLLTAASTPEGFSDGLLNVRGEDPVTEKLTGLPIAVLRGGFDVEKLLTETNSNPAVKGKLDDVRAKLRSELGLDFDKDIAGNLNGQLGAVVLKSEPQAPPAGLQGLVASLAGVARQAVGLDWPAGGVAWLGVRNPDGLRQVLVQQVQRLQAEGQQISLEQAGDGVWATVTDPAGESFGVGLTNEVLVVCAGPGFPARVRASLAGNGAGFMNSLPKSVKKAYEAEQQGYFYLDVPRMLDVADDNMVGMSLFASREGHLARGLVENTVQGISSRSWEDGDMSLGELSIVGPEDGFTAHASALGGLLKELEAGR